MAITRHAATVSFPSLMLQDLKAEAARRDVSLSQVVRELIVAGRMHSGQQGQLDLMRTEDGANGH